ncbi:hypothetical protein FOCC_FOCC015168 [Frankliniella occidentalis]|nr:hypothetical protein FOCC_FOCC015168 [Frankliniella occidentalis]
MTKNITELNHELGSISENNNKPVPISERLNLVVKEVKKIWLSIGFSEEALISNDKAKSKLESFNNRYLTLCKSKLKITESQRKIEIEFSHLIEKIFDVAKQSMENSLPANLRQFLANAREDATTLHKSCVEEKLPSKNKRERNSQKVQEQVSDPVACRSSGRMVLRPKSTCLKQTADSSEGSSCPSVATSGSDFCPAKPKKSKTVEESVPALDRTLSTVRGAAYILKTTLTTLNAPSTPTSTSSVYRIRVKTRAKIAKTITSEFSPQAPLTVHFDSKKMKSLTGESDIERFPVLVTGPGSTSQLLGAPALNSVTGEEQAIAVNELLLQWGIQSKTWLFRGQFSLTQDQETGLRQLCIFGFNVYIRRWFEACTSAAISPREDLNLLQELRELEKGGGLQAEATAALRKLEGALWYLSDRLIPLALFDDEVPDEEKELIARALTETKKKPSKKNHRWRRSPTDIQETTRLSDLITTDSIKFFQILNMPTDFLNTPANTWAGNQSFVMAKTVVQSLQVTNEIAESLIAHFTGRGSLAV